MGRFTKEVILKGPKGEKKVNLLIDTGAKLSVIDKKIADEIGLPRLVDAKVYAGGKEFKGDGVGVGIVIDGCKSMFTIASIKDAEKIFGHNVLGADALQQLDAVVEPKEQKIVIRKCEPYDIVGIYDGKLEIKKKD